MKLQKSSVFESMRMNEITKNMCIDRDWDTLSL